MLQSKVAIAGKEITITGEEGSYGEVQAAANWLCNNAGAKEINIRPDQVKDIKYIKYNGWPNYPTWLVYTWLGSCQEDYLKARRIAKRAKSIGHAADNLKKFIEKKNPLAEGGNLFVDMITYAIYQVDWNRLAERLIEDSKE